MAMDCIRIIIQSIKEANMSTSALHKAIGEAISRITFQGHRVNDDYSLNKRLEILKAIDDAIDSATPPPTNSFEVSLPLLVKLGSLVVHVEEFFSPDSHIFDRSVIQTLLDDPEVKTWIAYMDEQAFLPKKRRD